jgi:hypothetical protein
VESPETVDTFETLGIGEDTDLDDLGEAFRLLFDDETIAAAESSATSAAEELVGAGTIPADLGDQLPAAFRDVMTEIPEAAALTEAEIRALFEEISQEAAAEEAEVS